VQFRNDQTGWTLIDPDAVEAAQIRWADEIGPPAWVVSLWMRSGEVFHRRFQPQLDDTTQREERIAGAHDAAVTFLRSIVGTLPGDDDEGAW
jgi:hypothetical protein